MKICTLFLFLSFSFFFAAAGNGSTWTKDQLVQPADLAKRINSGKDIPLILNIGPMELIKTAVKVGPANSPDGIKKLRDQVSAVSKEREIVLYCGCCSSDNCPNIRPAYDFLKNMGYSRTRVLEIPVGLGEDWRAKGYPME